MKIKVFLSFLLVVFFASVSFSLVPTKISYQGVLKTSSGSLLTGSYNMRFSITSDSAGNSPVWGTESHSAVSVSSGIFSVILGETTALTPSVFSSDTRYLKVEVASPSDSTTAYETMTPLTQLLSVGYALRASTAEGVVDGSIIEASIADGSVSNAKITDGTITNAKVASGNFVKQIVAGNNITISGGTDTVVITAEGASGTLTRVDSGAGLTGGPVTRFGTLEVKYDNSTIDLNGSGSLEVKNLGITGGKIAATAPNEPLFLRYDGTSLDWANPTVVTGSFEVDNITIRFNANASIEVKNNGISTEKISDEAVTDAKISSITTAGKVSGNAIISGTIGGSTAINTTGGIQTTGTVTAGAFKGDGSQLTGITSTTGGWIKSGNTITSEAGINKVGIGTAEPVASFEVAGGILAQGTNGDTPVLEAGTTRLMWIPSKGGAFRSGTSGILGDEASLIGQFSFAVGYHALASGSSSTAMGSNTTASGSSSTAMGNNTIASGTDSTAMGNTTTASGSSSTAMGNNTIASGTDSTAMGNNTTAS